MRTLRLEFLRGLEIILREEMATSFGPFIATPVQNVVSARLLSTMVNTFDKTTIMDAADQMQAIAAATTPVLIDIFVNLSEAELKSSTPSLAVLSTFRARIASRATELQEALRGEFLTGARGSAPASAQLGKTKGMYEFIRKDLGIKMHGAENHGHFVNGIGHDDVSIGQNISKIYEVRRNIFHLHSACLGLTRERYSRLFAMGTFAILFYLCSFNLHPSLFVL